MQRDRGIFPLPPSSFVSTLTPILTRLRCAHLGVTRLVVRSFVRSFRRTEFLRGGIKGDRYRREYNSGAGNDADAGACAAPDERLVE